MKKGILTIPALVILYAACSVKVNTSPAPSPAEEELLVSELAARSVLYAVESGTKVFQADEFPDEEIRRKFKRSGLAGTVTVTFGGGHTDFESGLIDSTVIFKTISPNGIRETIFDFAYLARDFSMYYKREGERRFEPVARDIYRRRRPVSLM